MSLAPRISELLARRARSQAPMGFLMQAGEAVIGRSNNHTLPWFYRRVLGGDEFTGRFKYPEALVEGITASGIVSEQELLRCVLEQSGSGVTD